ncbi:MAG: metal ABC transporter substrate-binding protein [Patescibacteria group bacterium]|nr:metal ABC transporter substrate-binding protein [Patescibacteria group bacterium]
MRKSSILIVIVAILILGTAVYFSLAQKQPNRQSSAPKIAVSIFPLGDIARQIAGEEVEIVTILPRGASPHTYSPSPSDLVKMQGSKTLLIIGQGLDDWAANLASDLPGSQVISMDKDIELLQPPEGILIGEEEEGEEGADPHYWLSAKNGKQIARNISEALVQVAPDKADIFQANLSQFENKMDALDAEIKGLFASKANKKIVTHHDAWQYFTRDYGLDWIGSVVPSPGKNLTPQQLATLQKLIVDNGITTIFIEPQLDPQLSSTLAEDLKLKLVTLDPAGSAEDTKTYDDLLKLNAERIAATLQ